MKIEWKKLSIESLAIVTSILLAFAIEAWWAERQEHEVEVRLLQGFYSDLYSDADDLGRARLTISRRLWVLDNWLAELGDTNAAERLSQEKLDLLTSPDFSSIITTYGLVLEFDPRNVPLAPFESMPDFDIANDTYNEVVATGAMNVIQDSTVRSTILAYYRQATDQGENERRAGLHHERVEEVLSWINVAIGDPISFNQLVDLSRNDERIPVELRRAGNRMRQQIRYYDRILEELATFRSVLEGSLERVD